MIFWKVKTQIFQKKKKAAIELVKNTISELRRYINWRNEILTKPSSRMFIKWTANLSSGNALGVISGGGDNGREWEGNFCLPWKKYSLLNFPFYSGKRGRWSYLLMIDKTCEKASFFTYPFSELPNLATKNRKYLAVKKVKKLIAIALIKIINWN